MLVLDGEAEGVETSFAREGCTIGAGGAMAGAGVSSTAACGAEAVAGGGFAELSGAGIEDSGLEVG